MSEFKEYKFNIGNNPEVSEIIQKIGFMLGYEWQCYGPTYERLSAPYIFFKQNGHIGYGNDKDYFESDPREEINIEWMKPQKSDECTEDYIVLQGKRYKLVEVDGE